MRAVDVKRKEENGVYYKELLSLFLGMSGPDYIMVMADAMVRTAWVALVETMNIKRKATNPILTQNANVWTAIWLGTSYCE